MQYAPRDPVRRVSATQLILLLFGAVLAAGCASSESTQDSAASQAAVIGTWEYKVSGRAPLDQGVFRIANQDGQLRGIIRDRRVGRLRARVSLNDSRLELTLDGLRISGYIEDEQLTGFLHRQEWDVTSRRRTDRRARSQFRSASFYAKRVQSATAADEPSVLECRSLLREVDDCR